MKTAKTLAVWAIVLGLTGAAVYALWPGEQGAQSTKSKFGGPKGPGFAKGPGGPGRAGAEAVPVLVTAARRTDVPVLLDGVGTARALNTVTVRPQVEGRLLSLNFKEGEEVQRGDVLARIDPQTYQAQFDQAVAKKAQDEAQLANAKLDLERFRRLAASNAATQQQADTAQAQVNQLEAQVKIDQAAIDNTRIVLGYTTVTAPIAGRTGIRQVDEGNIVRSSDTNGIVVITQIRPISVFFNLPQQQLPAVNKGMAATGSLPAEAVASDTGAMIDRGELRVVDNQVDATTGTVRLKAEFPNAQQQLWPGQFVNVRLLVDTLRGVVVAPTAAVQRGPTGVYVYVVQQNDTVTMRPVKLGLQNDVQTVLTDGVQEGDRLVTSGFSRLADGTRVRISTPEEGQQQETPAAPQSRDSRPAGEKGKRQRTGAAGSGAQDAARSPAAAPGATDTASGSTPTAPDSRAGGPANPVR